MHIHLVKVGQGAPLVLLHGFGFDGRIFAPLIDKLSARYTLYFVDLPGFGQTVGMSWHAFVTQLRQQLPDSYAMLGWSMGGLWATRLLAEGLPISHLIHVCSSPCFVAKAGWAGLQEKQLQQFCQEIQVRPEKTLRQFIAAQTHQTGPAQTGADTSSYVQHLPSAIAQPEGLQMGLDSLLQWDLRAVLPTINVPTCYIFGGLDRIVSQRVYHGMITQYPEFSYVLFKRAAHTPFLSHTDAFVASVCEFLT